ncbi:hypothetical protein N0V95_010121, partial [Ascochyta clinopodiicola]
KEIEDLASKCDPVLGISCNGTQKCMSRVFVAVSLGSFEATVEDLVCDTIQVSASLCKSQPAAEELEIVTPHFLRSLPLNDIKGIGERSLIGVLWSNETLYRFTKQKLGSCIEGHTEEERLKVDNPTALSHDVNKVVNGAPKDI